MEIPKTMKAAVVTAQGRIEVKEVPVKEPGNGEVLIKLMTCGVCHSDLHVLNLDWTFKPSLPIIPGHEGAGIVAKVGPGVETLKVGDRVGSAWLHDSCLNCEYCLQGWETVCAKQHQTGFFSDGCFAEYTVANELFVGRIPDSLSYAQASPLLCAGVTAYKALKETKCLAGQWVVVHGAGGGLGHMGVQYGKAMGYKVIAVDIGADKMKYCKEIGARECVDASQGDVAKKVHEITKGGAHGVVVFSPATAAYEESFSCLRKRGVLVCVSLPPGSFKIDILDVVVGAKTIAGSIVGTRADLQETLEMAADLGLTSTIKEDKLENVPEIFEKMTKRLISGRVVLRIAPDPK